MPTHPLGFTVVDPNAGYDDSFVPPEGSVPLDGRNVFRRGDVVYRPSAPWTPTVHALLRHLEHKGFRGAPRLVGDGLDDRGRQTLTYVEGAFVHPRAWPDQGVVEVARLLRELHDATADFVVPHDAVWSDWYTHRPATDPIVGHGDVGPWNLVARDRTPVAFVDWEFAGPVDRLDEVAEAIRLNCQLHGEDVATLQELPSAERRAQQVALFADAYGVTSPQRQQLVARLIEAALRGCANDADEAAITPDFVGPHEMVWGMAWQARGGRWILDNRRLLEDALGVEQS